MVNKAAQFTGQLALPPDLLLLVILAPAHFWFNPVSSALGLAFIGLYIILTLGLPQLPDETENPGAKQRYGFLFRLAIVIFMLLLAAFLPAGMNMIARLQEGPSTNAHDGLVQTEIAIEYILQGKNPYVEDYIGTPMDIQREAEAFWTATDTPLYHFAYLPALFLSAVPLHLLSNFLLGWYDQRLLYLLFYLGLIIFLPPLVARQRNKLILLMLVGLNLLFPFFLAEGRNDIVVLFGLVLASFFLMKKHAWAAGIVLGIVAAMKHTSWFFFPFYFLYLYPTEMGLTWDGVKILLRRIWPFFVTFGLLMLPFLLWDPAAFIDDTLFYLIGMGDSSFPIRGWGGSVLLYGFGLVDSENTSFPFFIPQLVIGLPVLWLLLRRQWRENTLTNIWLGFALFSFTVDYFSRFFNDNYVMFVLQVLVIAAFVIPVHWDESPDSIEPANTESEQFR
jgi:hypothetical protein